MAFKFNRDCWVESQEDFLFGKDNTGNNAVGAPSERSSGPGASPGWKARSGERNAFPLSIQKKIRLAHSIFDAWGKALGEDALVCRLLEQLEQDIEGSRQAMIDFEIVQTCTHCDAARPEGSCCSRGIENKYDVWLLLINLLLEVDIPESGLQPASRSCCFLGPMGCRLQVRHMLCVDYLCLELERALGPKRLIEMQTIAGREIETSFRLTEAVKKVIYAPDRHIGANPSPI